MPRKGLNVPVMTVLDSELNIIEADQRNLIRHTIQGGAGVTSLFVCGTTGEFNRLTNDQRRQLIAIGVDEIDAENEKLAAADKVESWVGVTAESREETLENLRLAIELRADMAVVAPMVIADLDPADAVRFFSEDIAAILDATGPIEIGFYENSDISAHEANGGLLPFDAIRNITDLPFVTCAKASVSQAILEQYIREFAVDGKLDLPFYFGNAPMIFSMSEIQGNAGVAAMPVVVAGVVSGTGNVFPAEWRQAWNWVIEGRDEKNEPLKRAFDALVGSTSAERYGGSESKLLAGFKQALFRLGVISSPQVGAGTPALTAREAEIVNEGLETALAILAENVDPQYLSDFHSENILQAA